MSPIYIVVAGSRLLYRPRLRETLAVSLLFLKCCQPRCNRHLLIRLSQTDKVHALLFSRLLPTPQVSIKLSQGVASQLTRLQNRT